MQSFDSLWKCFFVDFQEAYRLMNLKRTKTCTLKFSFDCIESQQSKRFFGHESSKATNCSDLGYCLSYLGFVGLYPTDS